MDERETVGPNAGCMAPAVMTCATGASERRCGVTRACESPRPEENGGGEGGCDTWEIERLGANGGKLPPNRNTQDEVGE
jgi:hypothetical protein